MHSNDGCVEPIWPFGTAGFQGVAFLFFRSLRSRSLHSVSRNTLEVSLLLGQFLCWSKAFVYRCLKLICHSDLSFHPHTSLGCPELPSRSCPPPLHSTRPNIFCTVSPKSENVKKSFEIFSLQTHTHKQPNRPLVTNSPGPDLFSVFSVSKSDLL